MMTMRSFLTPAPFQALCPRPAPPTCRRQVPENAGKCPGQTRHMSIDASDRHSLPSHPRKNPDFSGGSHLRTPWQPSGGRDRRRTLYASSVAEVTVYHDRQPLANGTARRTGRWDAPTVCRQRVTVLLRSAHRIGRVPAEGESGRNSATNPARRCPGGNKNGVVWHNDAGEKDETVFNLFIGTRSLKSPVFLRGKAGSARTRESHKSNRRSKSHSIGLPHGGEGLSREVTTCCAGSFHAMNFFQIPNLGRSVEQSPIGPGWNSS